MEYYIYIIILIKLKRISLMKKKWSLNNNTKIYNLFHYGDKIKKAPKVNNNIW